MIPIWRDTYYVVNGDNSPFEYSLELENGETIFRGRAYAAPTEEFIRININKIAQDYLKQSVPPLTAATNIHNISEAEDAVHTFTLRDSGGNALASYEFYYDWSYRTIESESGTTALSEPINGKAVVGMIQLYSYILGGVVYNAFAKQNIAGYTIGNYCTGYALYYLNRNGGWDSFLPLGVCKRFDNYDRKNVTMSYDAMSLDWGKKTYNNQITPSWEINTGWLNDTESDNLARNLLGSNQVFVHDFNTDAIYPAILTDTQAEYKTFVNNGRKMINHTLRLDASQVQQNIG